MSTSSTVILGAGIIGCATAYYLSESTDTPADSIHLVDTADELFQCASGFAGGFLATDWFSPSSASLGALSFKLHEELAKKHNGRDLWGHSPTTTSSLSYESESAVAGSGEDWLHNDQSRANVASETTKEDQSDDIPTWLAKADGMNLEVIGSHGNTAQVHPPPMHPPNPHLRRLDSLFRTLFPTSSLTLPIAPLAGHSLILKSPRWTPAIESAGYHAIYATDIDGFSPEIFSRLGGELYICGLNSTSIPLPERTSEAVVDKNAIKRVKDVAVRLLGLPDAKGDDLEVMREALCFRPVTASGRPIVARVPEERLGGVKPRGGCEGGVFVAAGHGAWGISLSLGTGKVMSELVRGRPASADIKALRLP